MKTIKMLVVMSVLLTSVGVFANKTVGDCTQADKKERFAQQAKDIKQVQKLAGDYTTGNNPKGIRNQESTR